MHIGLGKRSAQASADRREGTMEAEGARRHGWLDAQHDSAAGIAGDAQVRQPVLMAKCALFGPHCWWRILAASVSWSLQPRRFFMMDQMQSEGVSSPDMKRQGIFLPTMIWTEDRQEVEHEKQRLLTMQKQLAAFVSVAEESDDTATWYMMADASLSQLDRDIDNLFNWLEGSERRVSRLRLD
jgi:hypothetical protein